MSERESLKVNFSTVIFLIIIFALIIVIMGMYIFYNMKDNEGKTNCVIASNENNQTVNEIGNNQNNSTNNNQTNETEINKVPKLSDAEAQKIVTEYFKIMGSMEGTPLGPVEYLLDYDIDETELKSSEIDGEEYWNTNVKYEEFKNKMLQYISKEEWGTIKGRRYKDVNGILYAYKGYASGWSLDNIKLTLESNSNNIYKYHLKAYIPDEERNFEVTVTIIYEDGHYVVSDWNY